MNKLLAIFSVLILLPYAAEASSKICFGSTKADETKGAILQINLNADSVTIKTIKNPQGGLDEGYNGTYPSYGTTVKGRDQKTYLEFKGEHSEYQDVIMVDDVLLQDGTTGLLQIRARGEGFFNSTYVCKDNAGLQKTN